MSDETFPIALGGRTWRVPHLSFRAIKAIHPMLFRVYSEAGGPRMTVGSVASLKEAEIEGLAEATWRAISSVDKELSYETFLDLAFSVSDLIAAFPSLAQAAGLRPSERLATREASPPEGKLISTR